MRTRAAVAFEAGKPLEIMEVDLEGPKAGEVLVEIKATGICHTDEFTLSGADPEGLFPGDPRARGRGRRGRRRAGRDSVKKGDHVIPLYTPECRAVPVVPQPQDQPLHRDPRDPGAGADAGRDQPLLDARWRADPALHGLLDLLELHGAAGDRGGEGARGRAVRQDLLYRLRGYHRHRRGHQHRQGRDRARRRWSSGSAASGSTSSRG